MFNEISKTIIVNAGHDHGSSGAVFDSVKENAETIKIKNRLLDYLNNNFEVFEVDDYSNFKQSIKEVNKFAPNLDDALAISIHLNAGGGEGAEVWFYSGSDKSKQMAVEMLGEYCGVTGYKSRGVKHDLASRFGRLGWIRDVKCWSLLIECCFIDNKTDMDYLQKNYDKVAYGIYCGVCKIYNVKPVVMNFDREKQKEKINSMLENIKLEVDKL